MSEKDFAVEEFGKLSEMDRRLIVNALKIAGGEFGSVKVGAKDCIWTEDYRVLVKRLHPGPWGPADERPACKHGCVPAFNDDGEAQSCWECTLAAKDRQIAELNKRLEIAVAALPDEEIDCGHCDKAASELEQARARIADLLEGLANVQKHRDHWRGYAYGKRDKPMDYLDGNMVDRPPTALEQAESRADKLTADLVIEHEKLRRAEAREARLREALERSCRCRRTPDQKHMPECGAKILDAALDDAPEEKR